MTELFSAMQIFHNRVLGTEIRKQRVEGVDLVIDSPPEGHSDWRFILSVWFVENPPEPGSEPVRILLSRVFSEIPSSARVLTNDHEQLLRWLTGEEQLTDADWLLADEFLEAKP